MKTAPPAGLPDTRTDPEALIKEARRRQRRCWRTWDSGSSTRDTGPPVIRDDLTGPPRSLRTASGSPPTPRSGRSGPARSACTCCGPPAPPRGPSPSRPQPHTCSPGPHGRQTAPGCSTRAPVAPVGVSGDQRPGTCLPHTMLPVHGAGRRAKPQPLTSRRRSSAGTPEILRDHVPRPDARGRAGQTRGG